MKKFYCYRGGWFLTSAYLRPFSITIYCNQVICAIYWSNKNYIKSDPWNIAFKPWLEFCCWWLGCKSTLPTGFHWLSNITLHSRPAYVTSHIWFHSWIPRLSNMKIFNKHFCSAADTTTLYPYIYTLSQVRNGLRLCCAYFYFL